MKHLLFIHGWSVTDTDTYGELPERLAAEAGLTVQHLYLGKYISFHDEVRMDDIACAMEEAVKREIVLQPGERFAAITHSTGGPVVRTWWDRFYAHSGRECPMSHVIHLAAAQFGSSLAQLGKGRLSRMKGFFQGVEPGQGVLDWLELGSPEAWQLNQLWIHARGTVTGTAPVFSFSLIGQQIDRKFYDQLNSYTGEMGSDGVVRVAASNLNASAVRLVQRTPTANQLRTRTASALTMDSAELEESERVPFRIVPAAAHSGEKMGIMRSVEKSGAAPVVGLIKRCLKINDEAGYFQLAAEFEAENRDLVESERVEVEDRLLLGDRIFFHDPCSMVILRVTDDHGYVPDDLRVLFTAGDGQHGDPNRLPKGFLIDTQRNSRHRGTITFFLNHDVIHGCKRIYYDEKGKRRVARDPLPGIKNLGITIEAFPNEGFAHYHKAYASPSPELLSRMIRPHSTVLVDVVLKRIIHRNTMDLTADLKPGSFKKTPPGPALGLDTP
ncbi:MAG: phospholipase [Verrucomicrobiae bacterium]|nr:phospholipase [Verrucomicrobiae bacterium]